MYQQGEILLDREQDAHVVVIQLDSRRADEVIVKQKDVAENRYSDQSVYDLNARFSYVEPQEPVIRAVYSESLPSDPSELSREGRSILAQNADVKTYSFPISRLVPSDNSQSSS